LRRIAAAMRKPPNKPLSQGDQHDRAQRDGELVKIL
jgi:hypothetical protein